MDGKSDMQGGRDLSNSHFFQNKIYYSKVKTKWSDKITKHFRKPKILFVRKLKKNFLLRI